MPATGVTLPTLTPGLGIADNPTEKPSGSRMSETYVALSNTNAGPGTRFSRLIFEETCAAAVLPHDEVNVALLKLPERMMPLPSEIANVPAPMLVDTASPRF